MTAGVFAHIDFFGAFGNQHQNSVTYKTVIDYHVSLFQRLPPAYGQKLRIARTCAYQNYLPCHWSYLPFMARAS